MPKVRISSELNGLTVYRLGTGKSVEANGAFTVRADKKTKGRRTIVTELQLARDREKENS